VNVQPLFVPKKINPMPVTGIFFLFFSKLDRNKGDIKRNICMGSVELKRVDGHLFRKMTIALVIHLTNVSHQSRKDSEKERGSNQI
jgi:hypothetical protein